MKKLLYILMILPCVALASDFNPSAIHVKQKTYKKMEMSFNQTCNIVKKVLPADYDKNSFYQVHEALLEDVQKEDYKKRCRPIVKEAKVRLASLGSEESNVLYNQALKYPSCDEAWNLFIAHMMKKYKESIAKAYDIKFSSLEQETCTDLTEKIKNYFIANKNIGEEHKTIIGSLACAHHLLRQYKNSKSKQALKMYLKENPYK